MAEEAGKRRVVALVPMKAHSERVRGKNFRAFSGKPLCRWIIETLASIEEIEAIVINTDAREILASIGIEDGPKVRIRDRAPALQGDMVSMNLIIADDLDAIDADTYIMTHTTNPLISAGTIRAALAAYDEGRLASRCDSLFTVNRFQTRFYRADGSAINHDPNKLLRTQDLEPWFEENSNLYVFSRESFGKTQARIGERPMMFETPRHESVDIDDAASWMVAEALMLHACGQSAVGAHATGEE